MQLSDINPFMRFAELQPSVVSQAPLGCSYDYRIFYILEGEASFCMADRTIPLTAGTLLYFRPGTPYYFDGKVKVIVINFDMTRKQADRKKALTPSKTIESFKEELIFENDPPKELEEFTVIENAFEAERELQKCLAHYPFSTPFSDALTSSLLKEILCYIVQQAHTDIKKPPEIVQRIDLYIRQNYDREIDNSQISAEFGYHSFYLNRIFKESTGMTLHQRVISERIRIAKRLLKSTDLSVESVATESGFSTRTQFCTIFRKTIGCTPTEYRKQKNRSDSQ